MQPKLLFNLLSMDRPSTFYTVFGTCKTDGESQRWDSKYTADVHQCIAWKKPMLLGMT